MTDRFSSLLEQIVHQIMLFLPPEGHRTNVGIVPANSLSAGLSRSSISTSPSSSEVESTGTVLMSHEKASPFVNHVTASLEWRVLTSDLERLSLVAPPTVHMFEVVKYALRNKVREMIITKGPFDCEEYDDNDEEYDDNDEEYDYNDTLYEDEFSYNTGKLIFPYPVFESTSIKKLSLGGFPVKKQDSTIEIRLMDEVTLTNSTATSTTINISCPNLKTLNISQISEVEKIQIQEITSESLESFSFSGHINEPEFHRNDIVNFALWRSLKALKLCCVDVDDSWLMSNVVSLALLESLSLIQCFCFMSPVLRSEVLKAVELKYCKQLVSVNLDTRSLRRFAYVGDRSFMNIHSECIIDLTKCLNVREISMIGHMAVSAGVWAPKFEFLETLNLAYFAYKTLNLAYFESGSKVRAQLPVLAEAHYQGSESGILCIQGTNVKRFSQV